jgi:hypothetical protein
LYKLKRAGKALHMPYIDPTTYIELQHVRGAASMQQQLWGGALLPLLLLLLLLLGVVRCCCCHCYTAVAWNTQQTSAIQTSTDSTHNTLPLPQQGRLTASSQRCAQPKD